MFVALSTTVNSRFLGARVRRILSAVLHGGSLPLGFCGGCGFLREYNDARGDAPGLRNS
jgi:hypothetical protein